MKRDIRLHGAALLAVTALWPALGAAQAAPGAAATPSPTPARVLAANCANCHGTAGAAAGAMPSLAGQSATYIAEQMRAFRDGKRPATIMHQLAKGYSDEQIAAIAAHFAAQKK